MLPYSFLQNKWIIISEKSTSAWLNILFALHICTGHTLCLSPPGVWCFWKTGDWLKKLPGGKMNFCNSLFKYLYFYLIQQQLLRTFPEKRIKSNPVKIIKTLPWKQNKPWTAGCFPALADMIQKSGPTSHHPSCTIWGPTFVARLLAKRRLGLRAVDVKKRGGRAIIKPICMRAACLALLVLRPETQIGSHEALRAT